MFKNIYEAERAITLLINKDNSCSAHFKYIYSPNTCKLDLVTYNPLHQTHFLLHSLDSITQIDALCKMYEYIMHMKDSQSKLSSYTIEWYSTNGKGGSFVSSFYGAGIEDVVKKFLYGKSPNSITIFSIKLNPIS
jgi:hypothetical protein